jgi:molybdopterin-guanine dinucleotide biosynthesis protein A
MGQDKALLPFRGGLWAQAIAEEVMPAAGHAVFVRSPAAGVLCSFGMVPDTYPGEGPLGGIFTTLQDTAVCWNLIVDCNTPNVTSCFLEKLLDDTEAWDVDALLQARPSHQLEPLCAVYHRPVRQALYTAFSNGQRKLLSALEGLPIAMLLVTEPAPLQNVNTPADWAAYGRG